MMLPLRIATRGSALALRQVELAVAALRERQPDLAAKVVIVRTTGDANQNAPIASLGDGVFVRGVEGELLAGRADAAVHSAKDMPSTEIPGLVIAAFPPRADPADALVTRDGRGWAELPHGARVGTGSPRRTATARRLRPDLDVALVRGNVDTRLRKLDAGEYDALILAVSGLERLDLEGRIAERLDLAVWLPAPGQGALAVQCVTESRAAATVAQIDDRETRAAVLAERAVLRRLGHGCRVPVGALGAVTNGRLTLTGALWSPDGRETATAELRGAPADAERLGTELADELLRHAPWVSEAAR